MTEALICRGFIGINLATALATIPGRAGKVAEGSDLGSGLENGIVGHRGRTDSVVVKGSWHVVLWLVFSVIQLIGQAKWAVGAL
jgi:hypothetical protein